MGIHAYNETYLNSGQRVMGDMMDYAINTIGMEPESFAMCFRASQVSKQLERGNPKYIAGKNGCELARQVIEESGLAVPDAEDKMYIDKSPEFWAGWILAYYQWASGETYRDILRTVSLSDIINMYHPYHEMDEQHFFKAINKRIKKASKETKLKRFRTQIKMSQSKLAREAGVLIRQIQLFEQRKRDIDKTQVLTLHKLAKVLNCRTEDLLEHL